MYRGSSPCANFITVIFQNFPNIKVLAKYLPNAKFGLCDFLPGPKVTLGKDPLYLQCDSRTVLCCFHILLGIYLSS